MSGSNLSDEELRERLREVAVGEAPGLLKRAKQRAAARAEQLIEDALVDELLAAVAKKRRPPPTPAEPAGSGRPSRSPAESESEAWWTYCIMWGADATAHPVPCEGVEPGSSVEVISDGELAALVSPVPFPEYGDDQLRVHLEDLDWVERTARRHEDVLEAALREATIVPLRLCTLYRTRDGVRRLLQEHERALSDGLSRVDGCLEWGAKVFCDARAPEPEAVNDSEPSESRGTAYLQQRQHERALVAQAGEVRARCVEVVHERLGARARASTTNPPQRPEVHGRELTMLLNGAYLVERDRVAEFREAARALQEEWRGEGFTIELTGPWPPYNFVSGAAGVMS